MLSRSLRDRIGELLRKGTSGEHSLANVGAAGTNGSAPPVQATEHAPGHVGELPPGAVESALAPGQVDQRSSSYAPGHVDPESSSYAPGHVDRLVLERVEKSSTLL